MSARSAASALGLGTLLGFVVSGVGFTSFEQLFAMLTLTDIRMLAAFAGAVALSVPLYPWLAQKRPLPQRRFHGGTVAGGILFGAGWFLSGACPGVVLAQLGQGKLWAGVTLAGVLVGTRGFQVLNARYFHIGRDSC